MIFDTHAHYDDEAFDDDRDTLLKSLKENNVSGIVNSSVDINTSLKSIELSHKYDFIYSAIGVHPQNIDDSLQADYIEILEKLLISNEKIVAIGEIGLDYHFDCENKFKQKEVFENQINLAIKYKLPIIVHDREAHKDTFDILKAYHPKGIVHCFSGSLDMAKEIIKLGMLLGIGGVLTFKNAKNIVEVVEKIPLEYLVLETDAPYLSPSPFRGKRCNSSYIRYVAEKIAEIKSISLNEVYNKTFSNAVEIFKIKN